MAIVYDKMQRSSHQLGASVTELTFQAIFIQTEASLQ